jgi:tetraacyldisaccharide 4'-kinase
VYKRVYFWIEEYLFDPSPLQRLLSITLLPLTLIYCLITLFKRRFSKTIEFDLPIISIGNLIVGGSGKTPLTIALSKRYKKSAIILRGYGRKSRGLVVVSRFGKIDSNVFESGDEAMEISLSLPNSLVIVSEDRIKAIREAKRLGAKVIFLDDAFSKSYIKKFEVLIKHDSKNSYCLPSGPYREPSSLYESADLLFEEGVDFKRVTKIENRTKDMILVTAISKPKRLDPYLPKGIKKIYFPDHYNYSEDELKEILKSNNASSVLTTMKDFVKMREFNIPISLLRLEIEFLNDKPSKIEAFIEPPENVVSFQRVL